MEGATSEMPLYGEDMTNFKILQNDRGRMIMCITFEYLHHVYFNSSKYLLVKRSCMKSRCFITEKNMASQIVTNVGEQ